MPHSNRDSSPKSSFNNIIPTKASHSGRKTSAAAKTAVTAALAVPVDPTGIALLTAFSSGTLALGGLAYHSGRKAVHRIEDEVARHRANKSGAANGASSDSQILALGHPQADDKLSTGTGDLQVELESCIRHLSASVTGVVVTGSMTFILPHFLLGVALNSAEFTIQARRLHKLNAIAESRGGVKHYLSSTDITFQVLSGILIKSAVSLCTLGTEVDTVIEGFTQLLVHAEVVVDPTLIPETWEQAGHIKELYDGLIAHDFLQSTMEIAGEPANLVAGMLGYEHMPTWESGASLGDVTEIGTANVLVDLLAGKLVEDPTHEVLDFASKLGRKFGWRGRAK